MTLKQFLLLWLRVLTAGILGCAGPPEAKPCYVLSEEQGGTLNMRRLDYVGHLTDEECSRAFAQSVVR